MGYYLLIDQKEAEPLGSNTGYGDLIRWVETLSTKDFPTLWHLTSYGWCEEVAALREQTAKALKEHPPRSAPTRQTAENMLRVLIAAGEAIVATVSDGTAPDDGADEDDEELEDDDE